MSGFVSTLAILIAFCSTASASELTGKITLDRRIVKKSLAPAVYDLRGIAVQNNQAGRTKAGAFGRVAVWLDGNDFTAGPATATMSQENRHFEPDLLIVPPGSKISFPNLDPIFHNIFSLSRVRNFDLGYYSEGKSREVVFPKEGIVQIYCHVHPEMYAVIVVTSSRWTARPNSDGEFSWSGIPGGKYRLTVWQRSAGLLHKPVTIPQSGNVQVEMRLPEEDEHMDR
jgi:plastocyanin